MPWESLNASQWHYMLILMHCGHDWVYFMLWPINYRCKLNGPRFIVGDPDFAQKTKILKKVQFSEVTLFSSSKDKIKGFWIFGAAFSSQNKLFSLSWKLFCVIWKLKGLTKLVFTYIESNLASPFSFQYKIKFVLT